MKDCLEQLQIYLIFGFSVVLRFKTGSFRHCKFSNWIDPHIFIGYPKDYCGYMYFNATTRKIIISRDVLFLDEDFSGNVLACLII